MEIKPLNLLFIPTPILRTERLILRAVTMEDAPAILTLRSNPTVMQYIDRPLASSLDDAYTYIKSVNEKLENSTGLSWGVYLQSKPDALIGTMGLWRIDAPHYRAEIGYMLLPEFHRQGIMQEAITATINYGFKEMNLHSIEAIINPHNKASKAILEKNRFVTEAYFKENYFYNGQFLDSEVLSLIVS